MELTIRCIVTGYTFKSAFDKLVSALSALGVDVAELKEDDILYIEMLKLPEVLFSLAKIGYFAEERIPTFYLKKVGTHGLTLWIYNELTIDEAILFIPFSNIVAIHTASSEFFGKIRVNNRNASAE